MPERTFSVKLEFAGEIDPSIKRAFENFGKDLEKTREKVEGVNHHLSEWRKRALEFSAALLGLREAKDLFEWMVDSGKEYLATQFEINDALERQYALLGRSPKAIAAAREELEKLSDTLEKTGPFGKNITEARSRPKGSASRASGQ
jgi:hypothetical protein